MGKVLLNPKKVFSLRMWKRVLGMVMYFVASVLALHDTFIIIAHSIDPKFMEGAGPYLLDKLLQAILTSFAL